MGNVIKNCSNRLMEHYRWCFRASSIQVTLVETVTCIVSFNKNVPLKKYNFLYLPHNETFSISQDFYNPLKILSITYLFLYFWTRQRIIKFPAFRNTSYEDGKISFHPKNKDEKLIRIKLWIRLVNGMRMIA